MERNITDADKSRFRFVVLMYMKTDENNCLTTVVFSDEATFNMSGISNRRKTQIWISSPSNTYRELDVLLRWQCNMYSKA
jgi:hypothetical protein